VGAPGEPFSYFTPTDYGAYVIFGRRSEATSGPSSIQTQDLRPDQGFRIVLAGGDGGFAVSSAGDFNGDGFGDVMVSAPSYGVDDKGATYIVFGKAGSPMSH